MRHHQFEVPPLREEDVVRLQVAVDDTCVVHVRQGERELRRPACGRWLGDAAAGCLRAAEGSMEVAP